MSELFRHIGPNTDVPAGDIGVGGREIGFLTLPPGTGANGDDDYLDWDWLHARPAAGETEHLRHLRFDQPLTVVLDGQHRRGVIAKPGAERL